MGRPRRRSTLIGLLGGGSLTSLGAVLWRRNARLAARAVIVDPANATVVDSRGAVRSIQAADLTLPTAELEARWSPMYLERLARTYWRFLTRISLGLIRVDYTATERAVVLLRRPFVLLRFQAPEYEMDADRGVVRWRIEDGILVARRGRGGEGFLQIDVTRRPGEHHGEVTVRVDVEVASFYPAIASRIGTAVYTATQSRIHVMITHGFLRSLARLDLAPSRVGRFAAISEVPDPPRLGERSPAGERRPAAGTPAAGRPQRSAA